METTLKLRTVGNSNGIKILNGSAVDIINNIVVSNLNDGVVPASATLDYNDVWNNATNNYPGTNGISADPLFVSQINFNFNLQPNSPCINAGDPQSPVPFGGGEVVDIGALESVKGTGDANGDEAINVADIVFLVNFVFHEGPAPDPLLRGDCNGDCEVNVADAVYLTNYVFKPNSPAPYSDCPEKSALPDLNRNASKE